MQSLVFQRFIAIFVGVLLVFAAIAGIITKDEGMIGMGLAVAALYALYLRVYFRRKKEMKGKNPNEKESPLLRR